MYHEFYQLHALPFENTPDPRFFFASEHHREALAAIEYTIRMRKGFVLVTGEIGSGKTTVGRTMCERCGDSATIVQVLHGHDTGQELVAQVLRALGLPRKRQDDHGRMIERLQDHALSQLEGGRPVVLLVDEAQTLSDRALEELRLLSNFDTATQKPIQIILIGQPELLRRIRSAGLDALRQRIVMTKQLRPLTPAESAAYIAHRLHAAGVQPDQPGVEFEAPAVQRIHDYAGGIPRLINVVCDNCLLLGFVRETRRITCKMVERVLEDMVPNFAEEPSVAPLERPALTLTRAGSL